MWSLYSLHCGGTHNFLSTKSRPRPHGSPCIFPTFQVRGEGRGDPDSGVRHRDRPRGGRVLQGRRPGPQLLRPPLLPNTKGKGLLTRYSRSRIEISSIKSQSKATLYADLLCSRPKCALKWHIGTLTLPYNRFYLISGYVSSSFYCIMFMFNESL